MKLSEIIAEAPVINKEEAKKYMAERPSESYQLIDVRQPAEYEEGHLAGAENVPLDQLLEGKAKIEDKPTLLYCRLGGRSKAAAQWLLSNNYKEVYDIGEHITNWEEGRALGLDKVNINLIKKDQSYSDAFVMAYAMEEGLRKFYLKLAQKADKEEFQTLFIRLANFEDYHKKRLLEAKLEKYKNQIKEDSGPQVMEGGEILDGDTIEALGKIKDIMDIFDIAMAIETQSFDLYARLARRSEDEETRKLFYQMSDEEKQHLRLLGAEADRYLAK